MIDPTRTTITVSGMGGCISTEMLIIQKALAEFGITVIVQDDHPVDDPHDYLQEMYHRYNNDGWGGVLYPSSKKITNTVVLRAQHNPWGG